MIKQPEKTFKGKVFPFYMGNNDIFSIDQILQEASDKVACFPGNESVARLVSQHSELVQKELYYTFESLARAGGSIVLFIAATQYSFEFFGIYAGLSIFTYFSIKQPLDEALSYRQQSENIEYQLMQCGFYD